MQKKKYVMFIKIMRKLKMLNSLKLNAKSQFKFKNSPRSKIWGSFSQICTCVCFNMMISKILSISMMKLPYHRFEFYSKDYKSSNKIDYIFLISIPILSITHLSPFYAFVYIEEYFLSPPLHFPKNIKIK